MVGAKTFARSVVRTMRTAFASANRWVILGWSINTVLMVAVAIWSDYLPKIDPAPQWVGTLVGAASISTTFLLGRKMTLAWYIMIFNQIGWGWVALGAHQTGLIISTLFFFGLGIHNLRLWIIDPPKQKKTCTCLT